jgi:diguanylate cyclase (GGDEF)-like protein/PAS domain S-box-containing protein
MPILDEHRIVLGTVAMYYREPREPTGRDWGLLEPAARLIRLALAQQRKNDKLREAETERRKAAALELRRMRLLSDMSQEILIVARNDVILQVNAAGGRMLGGGDRPLIGGRMLELISEVDHPAVMRRLRRRESDLNHEEIHLRATASTLVPVEFSCTTIDYEGEPATVMAFRDLTDRKRDEAKIRHLAHHDALTNLPNRFLPQDRLSHALDKAAHAGTTMALFYLDLDYFKPVNDMLGHAAGDALLVQVATRLLAELRPSDTLARVGGDEFVVVASLDQPEYAANIAGRFVEALTRPFTIGTDQVEIGTSVGIALYPRDGDSQEALMHAADTALYRAKHDKRGTFRFFEPAMDEHSQARQRLERDLRHAIERGEMQMHYQPLISCATGEVLGFEALLRWYHPALGLVLPQDFIHLAEKTGQIATIGQWAFETACTAAVGWTHPYWVAVNVSPVQFRLSDLPGIVSATLARTGLPAGRLEIEITEGVLMEDPRRAVDVLSALRAEGARIALDDFGTGYSSLGYLQKFRFDKLKIDRSFIARLGETGDATIIVRAIIGLAHSLGLLITAEGVETAQQLAIVRELMCDQVQGYLLGRPMRMDGSTELMAARAKMLVGGRSKGDIRLESDDDQDFQSSGA